MSEQLPLKSLTGNADPVRRRTPSDQQQPCTDPGRGNPQPGRRHGLASKKYAGMTGSYPWARTARSHNPVRLLSEINQVPRSSPDLLTTTRTKAGSLEDR